MLNKLSYLTLTFIIFFSPLALGAVHLWSETVLELSALLLFCLYLAKAAGEGAIIYRRSVVNVLFTSLILYTALQMYFGITVYPYQTYKALILETSYFLLFTAVSNWIRGKKELDGLIFRITLAGFLVAALGLIQFLTGTDKIYWTFGFKTAHIFGPFIYDNHFACYASITALITLGGITALIKSGPKAERHLPLRVSVANALDDASNWKALFGIFAFGVIAAGVFFSRSRCGISSFLAASGVFTLPLFFARPGKKLAWALALGFLTILLLVCWIGADAVLREMQTVFIQEGYNGRAGLYTDALKIFLDHPVTGIGIGAFVSVFPGYRSGPGFTFTYRYLHSDPLQFLIEAGIVGFLAAAIPLAVFLIQLLASVKKASEDYWKYLGMACFCVFFYLGLHSSIDFGMHANAISALFTVILALSSAVISAGRSGAGKIAARVHIPAGKRAKKFFYFFISAGFLCSAFIISKPLIADVIMKNAQNISDTDRAIAFDPLNDELYIDKYNFIIRQYENGRTPEEDAYKMAKAAAEEAVRLNPYEGLYMLSLGDLELLRKDYDRAYYFFKEAANSQPMNPRMQMACAYSIFLQAVCEKDFAARDRLLKKGFLYYQRGIAGGRLKDAAKNENSYTVIKNALKDMGLEVI